MDLLVQLANSVNFTFDLHLVEDGSYGTHEKVNFMYHFVQLARHRSFLQHFKKYADRINTKYSAEICGNY